MDIKSANTTVQESLARVDVDIVGVAALSGSGGRLEESARRLLPGARSVVIFVMEVYREVVDLTGPERTTGASSLNELMARHQDYLSGRATKAAYDVARASRKSGFKAMPLPAIGCPVDTRFLTAVFSYKHAAQAAGLGYLGRSSLLVSKRYGPRVRLACCLTEAALEPTNSAVENVCQGCDVCIKSCPAGALSTPSTDEPYAINKFACSAYRTAAGGCCECMRLCPAGV